MPARLTVWPHLPPQILCNFGLKVMEALSGTCTLWASGRLSALHLLCDTFVALLIVMLHAVTLMCQVWM